ncbi:MAG: hypothetical protein IJS15_02000 [Victivallales bacterium]|nr:hypothetical protein [Victivallales bacterium]
MKKMFVVLLVVFAALSFCSCSGFMYSHNANLVGKGKTFKVGVGDYGLIYVNGIFGMQGVRENSEMVIEASDGDSFADPTSEAKGSVVIRFRTGPQVTGYLVDLAKQDADAAKEYLGQIGDLNKAQWNNGKGEAEDGK